MPEETEETTEHIEEWCPSCGGAIDVTAQEPFTQVRCPSCGSQVRVRALFNEFTIQRLIGQGGMSRVFAATDSSLGRMVALKILNRTFSRDSKRSEQFEKEAHITASITHANVIKVFSAGRDQGQYYIAMEHVEGGSLDEHIRRRGSLPEVEVLDIAIDVVQGLKAAHKAGLIHRDIKPGNILFARDGTPKIVDFGLALFHETDVDDSGEIWATPFYVPPEKLDDAPDDFRGDIYSLGATLYHALVGSPPHHEDTASIDKLKRLKAEPIHLADAMPDASPKTCEVLDRMLSIDPDDRQGSYSELLEEVVLARAGFDAEPPGAAEEESGRGPPRALIAGALAVACLLVASLVTMRMLGNRGEGGTGGGAIIVTPGGGAGGEGGATITDRFLAAREAMLSARFEEASKGFGNLAAENDIPAETRGWTHFNAGLSHLLQAQLPEAREQFAHLASLAPQVAPAGEEGAELAGFWERVAAVGSVATPPSREDRARFDGGGFDPLGRLVTGLLCWQHGASEQAWVLFDSLSIPRPPAGPAWIAGYADLAKPYLSDAELLGTLPKLDPQLALEEIDPALAAVATARETLRTPGRAPQATARIQAWLEALKARRLEEAAQAALADLEEVRAEELDELIAMIEQLQPHGPAFRFAAAIETLQAARFESPEVVASRDDQLYLWQGAEACLQQFLLDLGERGWEGAITRTDAPPIIGSVASADRREIVVKLAFGESRVPLGEVADWIVRTAWQFAETTPDSTEHYRRMELLVAFARQAGLGQYARDLSTRLMRENRSFRERWTRVMQSSGTGV